jgi:hypothetical protein
MSRYYLEQATTTSLQILYYASPTNHPAICAMYSEIVTAALK